MLLSSPLYNHTWTVQIKSHSVKLFQCKAVLPLLLIWWRSLMWLCCRRIHVL